MEDPALYIIGTIVIRLGNAIIWTIIVRRIRRQDSPVPRLVRRLILSVIFFGMWALFIGSLTAVNIIPGPAARMMYTIYAAYSGSIGLAMITGRDSSLTDDSAQGVHSAQPNGGD